MAFVYKTTKFTLDFLLKMVRADVRLHNAEVVRDDMAIVFVSNHFTRIETILLPYYILKHTGRECWSLAAQDLFQGPMASVLEGVGAISTKDPNRDRIMIRELLTGEHPWVIFPEGAMIKDKKLVNEAGEFEIYHRGERRRPFTGAAVLALQAEFYRRVLREMTGPDGVDPTKALARFGVPSLKPVLERRTVVIPVNITYFPIRSGENWLLGWAQRMSENLGERAIEELSVEGTILGSDCDVDITLGQPIEIGSYLDGPEFEEAIASAISCECGEEGAAEEPDKLPEEDDKSLFGEASRSLMLRYMADIYKMTRLNFDHVFATLIRHQGDRAFTERAYRNRIFLSAHEIKRLGTHPMHTLLEGRHRDILYEEPSPKYENFVKLCLDEKVLVKEGDLYRRTPEPDLEETHFHDIRMKELTTVIANEIEPLPDVVAIIRKHAEMERPELSARIGEIFRAEDLETFEKDYAKHFEVGVSKGKEVGEPYLLMPPGRRGPRAGIVLVHGYLSAPLETRALGESLVARGYAVYGVRLRGHGTAPRDLSQTPWEEWYESLNRGYAVIKSMTDDIVLGGFSTGGSLALLAAARKKRKVRCVFAINAPLHLRNYAVHLIPPVSAMNTLLNKMRLRKSEWDFVDTSPENPHINYHQNPVAGVKQLNACIREMERSVEGIEVPTLLVQASEDPIVDPVSAHLLFTKIGAAYKELSYLPRKRHGIVNGEGREDVFRRVQEFLRWSKVKRAEMDVAAAREEAAHAGTRDAASDAGGARGEILQALAGDGDRARNPPDFEDMIAASADAGEPRPAEG